jgi:hypothetical protein
MSAAGMVSTTANFASLTVTRRPVLREFPCHPCGFGFVISQFEQDNAPYLRDIRARDMDDKRISGIWFTPGLGGLEKLATR